MWKFIQVVGISGFFICLFIMFMTNLGVHGIREYAPSFQSPDMRFHYSTEQITQTFEQIGEQGRVIYKKYLILDYVFTLCFAIVMLTITDVLFAGTNICTFMSLVCIFRGIFDVLENSFLLIVLKNYPRINTTEVTICSYFTTFKFVLLYIWIFAVIVQVVWFGIHKVK